MRLAGGHESKVYKKMEKKGFNQQPGEAQNMVYMALVVDLTHIRIILKFEQTKVSFTSEIN